MSGEYLVNPWTFFKRYMWPSLYEAVVILVISNASVFILVLMYMANTQGASLSPALVDKVVSDNVQSSEILVYVLALVAPATWIMISHWQGRRHLAFYWLLFLIQAVITLGSAIMYSISKSIGVANADFADSWAATCVALGVVIWYVTLIYEKWLPKLAEKAPEPSGKSILDDLEGGR